MKTYALAVILAVPLFAFSALNSPIPAQADGAEAVVTIGIVDGELYPDGSITVEGVVLTSTDPTIEHGSSVDAYVAEPTEIQWTDIEESGTIEVDDAQITWSD